MYNAIVAGMFPRRRHPGLTCPVKPGFTAPMIMFRRRGIKSSTAEAFRRL